MAVKTPGMDEDALVAAADLVGRTGARNFEVGYLHDDVPADQAGWWAKAQYQGHRVIEEDHRDPVEAAEALARRLLTGGKCAHCGGLVALSDEGAWFTTGEFLDGSTMTAEQARETPPCRWTRQGRRWVRGCENSTAARLARDLREAGAPGEMVTRAAAGYYDDYRSPLALPTTQLVNDLQKAGLADMAERAKGGAWDATAEESEAWARSPEGRQAFADLVQSRGGNRAERRAKKKRKR